MFWIDFKKAWNNIDQSIWFQNTQRTFFVSVAKGTIFSRFRFACVPWTFYVLNQHAPWVKITAPCYFPLSFHLFVFFFFWTSRKQIKFLTCKSIAEDFCLKNKFTSSFVTRLGVHFILNAIFKLLRTRQFPYVQMIKFNRFHIVIRFLHSWIV